MWKWMCYITIDYSLSLKRKGICNYNKKNNGGASFWEAFRKWLVCYVHTILLVSNHSQLTRFSFLSRNATAKPPPPPKLVLKPPVPRPPQREKSSSGGSLPRSPTYDPKPSIPRYSPTKPVVPPPLPPQRRSPSSPIGSSIPDVIGETSGQYLEIRQSTSAKPQVKRPILPPPKPPSRQTTGFRPSFPREISQPQESPTDLQPDNVALPISTTSKVLPPLFRRPGIDLGTKPRPVVKRRAPPRPTLHDESES